VPTGTFGPRLRAVLGVRAGADRLGKRPIRQLASDLRGLAIAAGMSGRRERPGAAELEAPVGGLREHVRTARSAHSDETSWRQGRATMWLWAAVTRGATVFTIARSRGAEVAQGLLGTARRKVVLSDRFKRSAWVQRRQFCWAHRRRDFPAMIARGGAPGEVGRRLREHSAALFRWGHRVRDGTLARSSFRLSASWLRACLRDDLRRGLTCGCARTAATCREVLAGATHRWTFVRVEGVAPPTNHAERAGRHGVISRQLSGGTASASGSRFGERMLWVVATCRPPRGKVLD
jgi:transposase